MAPLPAEAQPQTTDPTTPKEPGKTWTTATIVTSAVFLFLLLAFIASTIAFCLHKRKLRNQLPPKHRPRSYHPFRTESTDKSSLLSDAQTPDDDRSSMFSHERTSVSIYVDTETEAPNRRVSAQSMESVSLIPLHITTPDRHESLTADISNGSGVSASSSRYSRGSLSLSPIHQEDGDLGARPGRPRSTSASSVRYYGRQEGVPDSTTWKTSTAPYASSEAPQYPEIPRIVHTLSD